MLGVDDASADATGSLDASTATSLLEATQNGHVNGVRQLLENGVDVWAGMKLIRGSLEK